MLCLVYRCCVVCFLCFFFFKQKTAYEMRISDWSSDVCSSDLSKRMGQIVEDLLTLSRLETQHEVLDERVPMAALLATVRKEAEAISHGRHQIRSEERRVGKECVRPGRSRWSPYHQRKKKDKMRTEQNKDKKKQPQV